MNLPWALGETDLGDNVLEDGPGYGATTDVLGTVAARVTSVEIDGELAAMIPTHTLPSCRRSRSSTAVPHS